MHKQIAGLLGAAAALTTIGGSQAAPAPAGSLPQANSYADLLEPVANPVEVLKADDAQRTNAPQEKVQLAQYYHHHHHHHRYRGPVVRFRVGHHHHHYRRYYHHHHHHHHHGGFGVWIR